jgi:hypothetical protein
MLELVPPATLVSGHLSRTRRIAGIASVVPLPGSIHGCSVRSHPRSAAVVCCDRFPVAIGILRSQQTKREGNEARRLG